MTYFPSSSHSQRLSRRIAWPLLLLILLAGLTLRLWDINFDSGLGTHPDERSTSCTYVPTIRLPTSWEQFWDPQRSPLNPLWDLNENRRRSFTYGHFPLYLGMAMGHVLEAAAPLAAAAGAPEAAVNIMQRATAACDGIAVAGRLTIALLDTLTILLLYLLGRHMAGRGAGLLAAAFYAFAAQAIQLSHFFAMDPASTTFTVLAVLGAGYMLADRRPRYALLTGAAIGLAVASKFSALPLLALPAVSALLGIWHSWLHSKQTDSKLDGRIPFGALLGVLLAWAMAGIAFFVTSPYAVLDWQNFIQATLVEQGAMVRGIADMPFTRQYRNTTPYLYFLQQQVQWGLGWPLGLVAAAGIIFAAFEAVCSLGRIASTLLRPRRPIFTLNRAQLVNLIIWAWVLPYFGLTGAFLAKFNRYMSPLLPFVLLWAAWLIVWLWEMRQQHQSKPEQETTAGESSSPPHGRRFAAARPAAVILAVVGLFGAILWSLAFVNGVYGREHTWVTASRWMYANIPSGSTILWELWDDPLPKTLPGEVGMDMYSQGLINIDWSPYEEDTADKYLLLKQKLNEADYVVYSSKRIYDSVDELPQRYPMTNLYYQAMRDGRLGFELAAEFTSPPQLFGIAFDDRHADESWSLYDHPQVSVFRKVRALSDAEFDALFNRAWETAQYGYRGPDSPISPLLNLIGLGSAPDSANSGLLNRFIALLSGQPASSAGFEAQPPASERQSLLLEQSLRELPQVDDYRWNRQASANTALAVLVWWVVLTLLGWLVWPLVFVLFAPLRDRGYFIARTFGWLLGGWLLWMLVSLGLLQNLVLHAWLSLALLAVPCLWMGWRSRKALLAWLAGSWKLLLAGEAIFAAAYLFFIGVRIFNPDLWQPWLGGEKQMEFAFLNGILRSPTFPPVDPHFSGGFINYYYFGLYLVAYLIKLTGIYAEVAFNLTIATLFALTVINTFAVAYSAAKVTRQPAAAPPEGNLSEQDQPQQLSSSESVSWRQGFVAALLAPLFVTLIGNLDGFAQIVRNLANIAPTPFQSSLPALKALVDAGAGAQQLLAQTATLPAYDFWGPSRVLPATINEFPYWSFLFADLHPHIIGIPLAGLFLALALVLIESGAINWRTRWRYGLALLATFALLLGAMAAVNLWELPTYLGLGILAFLISQFRGQGRIYWGLSLAASVLYVGGAYLLFLPFFRNYVNIGASGIGLVRVPDPPEPWFLIWGLLAFISFSWLLFAATRPAHPITRKQPHFANMSGTSANAAGEHSAAKPSGLERVVSLLFRRFERLPRTLYLHQRLVQKPSFLYLLALALIPLTALAAAGAAFAGWSVLAICLLPLGVAFALLWRRGEAADAGSALSAMLAVTGLALLAGTQVVYLKDFLDASDYYRMNTLFKFFNQVWLLWGVLAGIAVPRIFSQWLARPSGSRGARSLRWTWATVFVLLLAASLVFPILGTPARLDLRMVGWRPPLGTLNGLDFMAQASYTTPDNDAIELHYDYEAIQWLLNNVTGNATIAESSQADYYRWFGTKIASNTGLSGLKGMHEQEQRYPDEVGYRDGLHRELWDTSDIPRTQQIIDELQIDLIYVGQLEHALHPDGAAKFEQMTAAGLLRVIFQNQGVTIYATPGYAGADQG